MDEALKCKCGSSNFHLLKNGMIECNKCTKHLNGGSAKWSNDSRVYVDSLDGGIITFTRKPDVEETLHVDASDGKCHTLTLKHEVS